MSMVYNIVKVSSAPLLDAGWDSGGWKAAEAMEIAVVRPESSSHHPCVKLKLLYDDKSIYGLFKVEDRYVRSVRRGYQKDVCRDSYVEFFFSPQTDGSWIIDRSLALDRAWHGGVAISRADGLIIGMLIVPEDDDQPMRIAFIPRAILER